MRSRPEGRVILFGATGYTGRLTAAEMVRQGLIPVLAGRREDALAELAEELGEATSGSHPLPIAVAEATDPGSVRGLLRSPGDVLVSTVGPFVEHGEAAVAAAVGAGAGYLDSTGEPGFLRRVFGEFGPGAKRTGAVLLPAFGYDYVPGELAAGLALARSAAGAGHPARVDIGYFTIGGMKSSAGTRASAAGVLLSDSFRWSHSELRTERPGARVRSFDVAPGKTWDGVSIGGIEHFTLPRQSPSVREVNVYVGWAGKLSKAASMAGAMSNTASRVPGVGSVWGSVLRGLTGTAGQPGSGPSAAERSRARTLVIAETFDQEGRLLQRVRVEGPSPYDLTASLLAWGAGMLLHGTEHGSGAMGPATAFGLEAFVSGCMALGLAEAQHAR